MTLAIAIERCGLGNLSAVRRDAEPLRPDSVRVAVRAVSLNYRDVLVIRGSYGPNLSLPLIPCSDAAGVVTEVGAEVDDLAPGDRVCSHMTPDWQDGRFEARMRLTTLGGPADGVLCEERVLPRGAVSALPEALSFEDAACLPVAGLSAWNALTTVAGVGPGSRVLLLGTGGVSIMGLAIAKALGAQVAITSSSDEKLEQARDLGADLTVNHAREPWAEAVRKWSDGGVDAVLEVGGDGTFDRSVRATRDGGCVALLGVLAHQGCPVNLTEVMMRRIRVEGVFVGSRAELTDLLAFVDRHAIRPVIDRSFEGLSAARHAFAHLISGRHLGKVVIAADAQQAAEKPGSSRM